MRPRGATHPVAHNETATNNRKEKKYLLKNNEGPGKKNNTLNLLQITINLLLFMCVLFYSSFVCISAYANVYFKTTIIKQNITIILIAGVPSIQTLPGFLITAPPSVCVPDVFGVLAVWIQKQN